MSDDTTTVTSINSHLIWSSNRYYEIVLMTFGLGLTNAVGFLEEMNYAGIQLLFAYIAFLVFLGMPLLIVQLSLGQYNRKGGVGFWEISPVFKGFAYLVFIYNAADLIEVIMIDSKLLRYIFMQFLWKSGWDSCSNSWNTDFCYTLETNFSRRLDCYDSQGEKDCDQGKWQSNYFQYYYNRVATEGTDLVFVTQLVHNFLIVLLLGGIVYKEMRMIEKVISISLCTAAVCFAILFYFTLIHKGAGQGLVAFIHFDLKLLMKPEYLVTLFKLTVFSTGLGTGWGQFLGAQNKFRGHSYRNGMMIILLAVTVTILELMFYLSLCGSLSFDLNHPVSEFIRDREPLLYVRFPKLLESLKGPNKFWNIIYFAHLFLIMFSKTILIFYMDLQLLLEFIPRLEIHRNTTILIMCGVIMVFCIPIQTRFGIILWALIDTVIVKGASISITAVLHVIVIIYVYGLTTLVDDMHFMLGFRLSLFWQIMLFLPPIILFVLCVFQILTAKENFRLITNLSDGMKQFLRASIYMPIIITVGYAIWHVRKLIWYRKWENVFAPSESWFLADPILRKSREMFSSSNMTEEYLYRQSKRREISAHDALLYYID